MPPHIVDIKCPQCGGESFTDVTDMSQLSDAELREYKSGDWATLKCEQCGYTNTYEFM